MPSKKITAKEIRRREQQMQAFRYNAAQNTGFILSVLANVFIVSTFAIFISNFVNGIFAGANTAQSFIKSFYLWESVLNLVLPLALFSVLLLAFAVKLLTHDATGKDLKKTNLAMSRTIFSMTVFMLTVTILYFTSP